MTASPGGGAGGVRHLYVHLPFCVHRCGYCDFVTSVGRLGEHGAYADALVAELGRERCRLDSGVETVFVGGGTPTFTEPAALRRVLAALPEAGELTVEANPETVTTDIASLLRDHGVNRVSVGAQSFRPALLQVLERVAGPDDVRRAVDTLRDAGFDNISLDLIYGIPGQSAADLEADLADALALEPEHLSCYELEAKPGTRFTHAHGAELTRQAEAMEGYAEQVVETLTGADTAGTRRPTSASTTASASFARDTTWRSGVAPTTWVWVWARCRRSATNDDGTCRRWGATWPRSAPARSHRARSSASTRRPTPSSG